MEYGLIGEKLRHSFSREIHEKIGNYCPKIPTKFPASLIQAEPNKDAIFEITHA